MTAQFGDVLRRFRVRSEVSQNRVAVVAGLDPSFVCRLEAGERLPSYAGAVRLANALGLIDDERDEFFVAAGYFPPGWDYQDLRELIAWRGRPS